MVLLLRFREVFLNNQTLVLQLYRPTLYVDGDKWCALLGENIQIGVVGFGASPDEAMRAFDKAWFEKLPQQDEV